MIADQVKQEVQSALSAAEKAVAEADNLALFNQVKKSEEAREKLARAMDAIVGVYGDETIRRPMPHALNDNAIAAMRDVALACVELAKAVVAAK